MISTLLRLDNLTDAILRYKIVDNKKGERIVMRKIPDLMVNNYYKDGYLYYKSHKVSLPQLGDVIEHDIFNNTWSIYKDISE